MSKDPWKPEESSCLPEGFAVHLALPVRRPAGRVMWSDTWSEVAARLHVIVPVLLKVELYSLGFFEMQW